ncbi:MAG: OmpH family outer membrane protein [Desulfuromonadaceae bacterium]|nr:OmpH family outer membrane protein [Desulfuromonadaceae bacterium]
MRQISLLLLSTAMLCSFTVTPSSAADQPPALSSGSSVLAPPTPASPTPAVLPAAPPALPAVTVKIGVIDMERISSESAMGKAAKNTIMEQQQKLQKKLDGKKRRLEKMKEDLERKMPSLQPAQREAKAKEFQKKVEELQRFGMGAEKELMATKEKLTKELIDAIEQAAVEIGKTRKLATVVVKQEVLFLGSGVDVQDISEDIVTQVNGKPHQK